MNAEEIKPTAMEIVLYGLLDEEGQEIADALRQLRRNVSVHDFFEKEVYNCIVPHGVDADMVKMLFPNFECEIEIDEPLCSGQCCWHQRRHWLRISRRSSSVAPSSSPSPSPSESTSESEF